MIIEILFREVCDLYGDGQNITYLEATLPNAQFIYTALNDQPYFAEHDPDLIYIGAMSESTQRKIIEKFIPLKDRIVALIEKGVPILATGNAGEIFTKEIHYVTEGIQTGGLGIFDVSVKTDLFRRYNGKVLGKCDNIDIVGFRSQFSMIYGDNSQSYFLDVSRGIGINPESKLEGLRQKNLICTHLIGPILPLNPIFCEYFIGLTGEQHQAAYRDAAIDAYQQRLKEFSDPNVSFN